MLFHSLDFLFFFFLVAIIYWRLPHSWQNRWLVLASYFFYAYWDWRLLSLLLISTALDFFAAQIAYKNRNNGLGKAALWTSIIGNLSLLGLFKYHDFFVHSFAQAFSISQSTYEPWLLNLILPVGISFYTFQTMSYTIDCYKHRFRPRSSWTTVSLYVAFFPQLIAGPIERAKFLISQIEERRLWKSENLADGALLFSWGLMKKTFIGDRLTPVVDFYFRQPTADFWTTLLAGLLFTFKVYFDYSGYCDMARGLAKILGFQLSMNFKPFYLVKSATQFWNRWNITLTHWVRDYLFYPMAQRLRQQKPDAAINGFNASSKSFSGSLGLSLAMLISFAAIGFWHGPKLNFVLFGLFSGFLLVCHPFRKKLFPGKENLSAWLMLFHIPFSGVLFMAYTDQRWDFVFSQFTDLALNHKLLVALLKHALPFMVLAIVVELLMEAQKDFDLYLSWPPYMKTAFFAVTASLGTIVSATGIEPFFYFQF